MHTPDDPNPAPTTPPEAPAVQDTSGAGAAVVPAVPGNNQQAHEHLDILLYLRVLLAGWWIILPMTLLGGVAGYLIWFKTPAVYRASCRMEILFNFKLGNEADLLSGSYRNTFIKRNIIVLRSSKLNRQVREALEKKFPDATGAALTVRPLPEAADTMINIYVDSYKPEYSLEYLQELLTAFNDLRFTDAAAVSETTLSFLKEEQANYAQELQEAEDEIVKFEAEHDVMFEEKRAASHQALLASLINQEARIATQRNMIEEQFPFLDSADPATLQEVLSLSLRNSALGSDTPPDTTGNGDNTVQPIVISNSVIPNTSEVRDWRNNEATIIRLEAEYKDMLATYKPTHPKMIKLNGQLEEAKRNLRISAELTIKRLKSRRDALKMQQEALTKAADKLRLEYTPQTALRAQYDRLKTRANRLSYLHDNIHDRIVDINSSAVDKTLSRLVEDPAVSHSPIWPVRWKIMSVSVFVGAGAGVALVLLIFVIRSRLYDFEGLERQVGLTCLAGVQQLTLTRLKRIRTVPIVVSRERNSTISEAFRSLRTSIEASLKPTDRILLLTSPEPSEGKTLLALNTAAVFSWNRRRVLVIDGDFRKLSLRKAMPDAPTLGLTDLLATPDLSLDECIVESPLADVAPKLDYLPAGHKKEDTAELLTLGRIRDIFQQLRDRYDLVIIDSAPVNRVVDTILLARHADALLLVARYGKTTVPAMRYCYSRVGSTRKVIGYVLNGIDRSTERYSYYSSYGYYYGHSRYYYHSYAYKGYYGDNENEKSSDSES